MTVQHGELGGVPGGAVVVHVGGTGATTSLTDLPTPLLERIMALTGRQGVALHLHRTSSLGCRAP